MNAFARVDKQTFLRFAADHPGQRFEYVRGRIVQQITGGTRRHGLVARRITRLLEDQLDPAWWTVLPDRGIETEHSVRYPEVAVEPADEPQESLATRRPSLVVEVLSAPTADTDPDVKPGEYMTLSSLDAYIVASQSEPAMLLWARAADGTFPAEPTEHQGLAGIVQIAGRGFAVALPLADIDEGIC